MVRRKRRACGRGSTPGLVGRPGRRCGLCDRYRSIVAADIHGPVAPLGPTHDPAGIVVIGRVSRVIPGVEPGADEHRSDEPAMVEEGAARERPADERPANESRPAHESGPADDARAREAAAEAADVGSAETATRDPAAETATRDPAAETATSDPTAETATREPAAKATAGKSATETAAPAA